ncbi:MAG: Mur ligase family protein [Cardiobacteriaceae bacterium]|nr:Mur ligase family protein [Cardiobacteriaceae bacterium]
MSQALCERECFERKHWSLNQWLSFQEAHHPKSWDLGLERIGQVWQSLGAPPLARHTITIAGTNGKGSCVRWLEALCLAHEISVMSFSSPHLLAYNERIRTQGNPIADEDLVLAFQAIDAARGEVSLTYFEWSALAMFYLSAKRFPEVAVLEVGLGGRLDATNLIDANSAIFTRIGLDHQDWLGHDIETIALEKAGILRTGQHVFLADQNPPHSLLESIKQTNVKALWHAYEAMTFTEEGLSLQLNEKLSLPKPRYMAGKHQYGHFTAAALALHHAGFTLHQSALTYALEHTQHFGRLMVIQEQPFVLVDVAHNADSAEILAIHLRQLKIEKRIGKISAVCGMLNDKDHIAIFHHLQDCLDELHLATLDGVRGTEANVLAQSALNAGISSPLCYADVKSALTSALSSLQDNEALVVFGSFVTVAQALPVLDVLLRNHHAP